MLFTNVVTEVDPFSVINSVGMEEVWEMSYVTMFSSKHKRIIDGSAFLFSSLWTRQSVSWF